MFFFVFSERPVQDQAREARLAGMLNANPRQNPRLILPDEDLSDYKRKNALSDFLNLTGARDGPACGITKQGRLRARDCSRREKTGCDVGCNDQFAHGAALF